MLQKNGQSHKNSYDDGADIQELKIIQKMFPSLQTVQLQDSLLALKENYDQHVHARKLINYCYRCHQKFFTDFYNSFRVIHHPTLKQPNISLYYSNQSFVNLNQLANWFDKRQKNPYPSLLMIGPIPNQLCRLLDQLFTDFGYIPNYEHFLLFYPTYLQKHLSIFNKLFESNRIDSKISYFLGICAAGQLGSIYMLSRMCKKFREVGGNESWLINSTYPLKLHKILILNRKLARFMWKINFQDIEVLLQNGWNIHQIALCVQIIAYVHQMSTISLAMGLIPEETVQPQFLLIVKLKQKYDAKTYKTRCPQDKLSEIIPKIEENNNLNQQRQKSIMVNPLINDPNKNKTEQTESYMKQIGIQLVNQQSYISINKILNAFLPPYEEFPKVDRSKSSILEYSDFNFKFMVYPILHNLTPESADKLLDLLNYSNDMTCNNFGSDKINNTRQFRRAMRYYSENLCNYKHQEYDYRKYTTLMLTMSLKFYIRLLTLSPFHINPQVLLEINHEKGQIGCFDLGHIAILIANTKMSLQLVYCMQQVEL